MLRKRIIPTILLKDNVVVKGINFDNYNYIGDPINIVRIFSDKPIDELMFFRIDGLIDIDFLDQISSECFIPFSIGGSIRTTREAALMIKNGAEKVVLNSVIFKDKNIIKSISNSFGSQAVVVCIDIKKIDNDYILFSNNGKTKENCNLIELIQEVQFLGAGEILVQLIDRDGTFEGYDLSLISLIKNYIHVPFDISCGAKNEQSLIDGFKAGADTCCAGSMFVYKNNNKKSILINIPNREKIDYANV
jgi:cyclase